MKSNVSRHKKTSTMLLNATFIISLLTSTENHEQKENMQFSFSDASRLIKNSKIINKWEASYAYVMKQKMTKYSQSFMSVLSSQYGSRFKV